MGRRKQIVPKKTDNLEDQSTSDKNDEGSGGVESDGGSESTDEQEVTMPTVDTLEPATSPPVPPPALDMSLPMDLLKNPFLLPAQLLALNPSLYAAQLAQLQAAQLMLARQHQEQQGRERKRSAGQDNGQEAASKSKYPRSMSPCEEEEGTDQAAESPLDLSGSKSPDPKREQNAFNPLLPSNILSFFSQLKAPVAGSEFSSLLGRAGTNSHSSGSSPPRTNPWQSQWINKNSDGGSMCDVFKCVWCRESYQTLEDLTTHMKEAKHPSLPYSLSGSGSHRPHPPSVSSPNRSPISVSSPISSTSPSPKPSQAMPRDLLKEQMPLPRKLVRGQDVWIGRADQQTRDILKCMGCGQSFRSLDLLTKHMQETEHYKKVISSDQLSAWKYPDSHHASKSHINSVLTCKVCEKAFGSLKDLSEHMIKANHYTGEGRGIRPPLSPSAAALARDRKKALPVKKLLELERARHEVLGGAVGSRAAAASARDIMETGKLFCERCEDRIPLDLFISHIQHCVGRNHSVSLPPVKTEDSTALEASERKPDSDKMKDSNSSILGSLEQMVKGNFQALGGRRYNGPSPHSPLPPLYSPVSSLSKFSVSSMLPKEAPVSPSSSPGVGSTSPAPQSSPVPLSSPPPPAVHTNGKIKQEIDSNNQTDGSAASPSPSHMGSPTAVEINDNPVSRRLESPVTAKSDVKPERLEPSAQGLLDPIAQGPQRPPSENPLAALQMLCDTQRKSPKNPRISETNPMSDPGAMMAFSWACNQAVSSDSAIKCPFCDTPFISKGAYRHHLSKMHFTKDPGGLALHAGVRSPSPDTKEEETIQSKYAKYSQLAKQLSCNQK